MKIEYPIRGSIDPRSIFGAARFAALLLLLLFLPTIAAAQSGATISGHITDDNGARINRAAVHLRTRSGLQILARTNDQGDYAFTGLGPGEYFLEIVAKGFSVMTTDALRVERGQSLTQDFSLSVAELNENVVVVATGTVQRADDASKAVTVLDEREIENRRTLSLSETLRGTPGLRVQQQGSPGALTTLRFRGLRNWDTALLLDGLRVRDSADINGSVLPFLSDLTPLDMERVEVLRGTGSSIYGTNAIGGVINLAPNVGTGTPRFEAGVQGGSLALISEGLKGSGGIGDRAGYSFGLSRTDVRRGVDGNDEFGNSVGVGRLIFNVTPSISIGGNFYGTISNARVNRSPFALAGAFNTGQEFPEAIPGQTFQPDFNNPDAGRRNVLLASSVRFTQTVNEMFSYTVAYQHVTSRRRNYDGPQVDPRYAAFVPFGDFVFNSTFNGATDTVDARGNLQLGRNNLVTAGVEFERETLFQEFVSAFGADPSTSDRQRTFAVFGQDQLTAFDGRLQMSIGVRGQFFRISAADRPGFLGNIDAKSSVTGDGSIAYFFNSKGTKLRAHVGNGFRAPSLFERFGQGTFQGIGFTRFGDPTIRAEQSIGIDGGFDQKLAGNRLRFGLTYFYTKLQRTIAFTSFQNPFNPTAPPDPLGLGRSSGYLNRPGGIARGLESYLDATPFRQTAIRFSYTYTNSDRFVPAFGLRPEYVTPNHMLGLNVDQRYRAFTFNFNLYYNGSYISQVFENDFPFRTAELTFGSYIKADLFVAYERQLTERIMMVLFGGGENLFDEEYFENGFRAPAANGRGGVTFRF